MNAIAKMCKLVKRVIKCFYILIIIKEIKKYKSTVEPTDRQGNKAELCVSDYQWNGVGNCTRIEYFVTKGESV